LRIEAVRLLATVAGVEAELCSRKERNIMSIPGYTYGTSTLAQSPVSLDDFALMKKSVLYDDDDEKHLRLSHDIVKDQVESILDVWYGFVGSNPHLLASFAGKSDGRPLGEYLAAVRKRFGQWILDTARAEYGQKWLDYQHEIGLRHHRAKKNITDSAASTELVPFRNLFALIFPVTFTLKPFLAKRGHSPEDVEKMYAAWVKSCILQVTLWSHAYVKDGDF
jgi:Protoglobin